MNKGLLSINVLVNDATTRGTWKRFPYPEATDVRLDKSGALLVVQGDDVVHVFGVGFWKEIEIERAK